jgi:tetratricopeptide (TPR) repeat protein
MFVSISYIIPFDSFPTNLYHFSSKLGEPMSTSCPRCNLENLADSKFCKECGTQLIASGGQEVVFTKTLISPAEALSKGTLFAGRYEIVEELGKGGMGKVYKALDNEIQEEVAIKLLKPDIAADEKIIERFRNELKIARKITHENVCRTYHIGREENTLYITMEYVPGEDLKSQIKRKEKLSKEESLRIAKQVCEGLVVAHKLGVVHRDLKPQNIMIDENGNAKIMDFGIARSVEAKGVTEEGMIIGTPDYISPEQADGEAADHRSDIYSLGVILYEMVTGTVPFKGDTALSVALKHKSQFPLDPRKLNQDVSDDLSRLILICMEKDRERRYQSAEALLNDLRNIEEGLPLGTKIQLRRATFIQTLIRKKLFIPVSVFVLAVIAVLIWQLLPRKGTAYPPKIENSIAVISFENQTGDETLDIYQKSIPNLLITSLEQTDLFYVATRERLRDLLKQIGKDEVEIITSDLGFEACKREGIEALVLGSYTKIDETFATDIKVLDVDTKRLLKTANSRGEGVNSIFSQIDELIKQISEGMEVPGQKIKIAQTSITDLTTSSIEAYNYYIRGVVEKEKHKQRDALRFLNKAIELDPDFAMAHLELGWVYLQDEVLDRKKWREYTRKAKDLSDKVSEKERLYIEWRYTRFIEGDREEAEKIIKQLIAKYPREKRFYFDLGKFHYQPRGLLEEAIEEYYKTLELDPNYGPALNSVGYLYSNLGNFERSIEVFKRYASAFPGDPNPLDSMGEIYLRWGKLEDAISKFKETLEVDPDFYGPEWSIAYLFALKENYSETLKWIDQYIDKAHSTEKKAEGYWWKGFYYGWLGNRVLSFDCLDKVYNLAEESGRLELKNIVEMLKGWIYIDREDIESGRNRFQILFGHKLSSSDPAANPFESFILGSIALKEENINIAKSRLKEMESLLSKAPSGFIKSIDKYCYDLLKADIQLFKDSVDEAIATSEVASTVDIKSISIGRGMYQMAWYNFPFQRDVLARAYQQKGELDKAIEWYEQHIFIGPHNNDRRLIPPKYHYKLAVLYEEKGRKNKAIEQYEKFLDLWKDPDPDHPEIGDAKKRLAALKN